MSDAPSPDLVESTQVTFTVKVDGKPIDDTIQVVSIDVWSALNKLAKARIVIFDGSPARRDFELSNQKTFLPGRKVTVAAGYLGRKETTIFAGVIVKQGIEIRRNQASRLIVDLTDEAVKMTLERKNGLFEKIKDGDLIGKLISRNGLAKDVAATRVVHEEIVQYYATDWDTMLIRAEMNGLVVLAAGGKVTVRKPDTGQAPVLRVEYGESILDLTAQMNAATQIASSAIKSHAWDATAQKVVESGPGRVEVKEQGNVSSAELAKVFGVKDFTQQTAATIAKTSLQDWSSAELIKSTLSKIRGDVRFQGSAEVLAGKTLELAGLGNRFNGIAYVSGVHHLIEGGKWLTTAELGLSPRWFAADTTDLAAPGASGLLPPIRGLQTGIVKQVAKDPGGEFRVLVELPLLRDKGKGVWARLGTFYASNKVGALFYPEIGDEVVLGFMNQDPSQPVILAGVYSKKLAPPYTPDDKNDKKAIVTRSKLEIVFDEKDKVIEIKTPGGHRVTLDDKGKKISIADGNKNSVTLARDGITLDSAAGVTIKAKRDVTIQAAGNLKLSAKVNASMEGLQVAHKAKTKFSAQGNAAAELKASGMLTVRGAVVKIN